MQATLTQKLTVLYSLRALGYVTESQLLRFMTALELIDYMQLRLTLSELLEAAQIGEAPSPLGVCYGLTRQGEQALSLFATRLYNSVRTRITAHSPEWLMRFRQEKQFACDTHPLDDGRWQAELKIREGDLWQMMVFITVADRATARALARRFPDCAEALYKRVYALLSGGLAEAADPLPPEAALVDGEMGLISLSSDASPLPDFTLVLRLPDAGMANSFAQAWLSCRTKLYEEICALA